jgi:hypothetical protein
LLLALAACGDDGGSSPDARPGRDARDRIDAGDRPDADPNRPDANPGAPDAAPIPGGGNFTERIIASYDASASDVQHVQGTEIVDIDKDGDADVIATFSRSDNVYLYLNRGDATAWTRVTVAPKDTIVAMDAVARDLDGDSDLDIAVTGLFPCGQDFASPGDVVWYENPGGNLMGTWERHEVDQLYGARSLASADLDGDDRPDLIVGAIRINSQGDGVHWYRNTGGAFAGPTAIDANLRSVASVQVADIDGNDTPDVVAAGQTSQELVWYQNRGGSSPTFNKRVIASGADFYSTFVANMDEDAAREVVASRGTGLVWYDPPLDPIELWTANTIGSFGGANDVVLAAADIDGDGDNDVAASARPEAEVSVFLRDGDSWTEVPVTTGYAASFINVGDVNGDRRYDLVTSTYDHSDGDRLAWWENME